MTIFSNDIHRQFAEFFPEPALRPFAYLLSQRLMEGHVCIQPAEVLNQPPYNSTAIPDWSKLSLWVGQGEDDLKPFYLTQNRLYLQRYYRYECAVIRQLKRLVSKSHELLSQRKSLLLQHATFIRSLTAAYPDITPGIKDTVEAIDWQLAGALRCLLSDFSILTGGPGTGKTTTLAKLLKIYRRLYPEAKVFLVAPTGKAAMRMSESLRRSVAGDQDDISEWIRTLTASTIHNLLGYQRNTVTFRFNANNPLSGDLIIADEASMIDLPLMSKLMEAIGAEGRLILLGDQNQLASVEAGSLLGDLCHSAGDLNHFSEVERSWINQFIGDPERIVLAPAKSISSFGLLSSHITELKFSHRFNNLGPIGQIAQAVLEKNTEHISRLVSAYSKSFNDALFFDTSYQESVLTEFIRGFEAYVHEPNIVEALKKFNSVRILAAVREGKYGVQALNNRVEQALLYRKLISTGSTFYEHRPILVTRNNYELGLMNGDVGILRKDDQGVLRAWFESATTTGEGKSEVRSVLPAYLTHVETTFSMTIHKSQGSEYDKVLVVLPDDPEHLILTRELLYTAITRAKKSVIISASEEQILRCAAREVRRVSGIRENLKTKSTKE